MFCVFGSQVIKNSHTLEITAHVLEERDVLELPGSTAFVWLHSLHTTRQAAESARTVLVEYLVRTLTGEGEEQAPTDPDLHIVFAKLQENDRHLICRVYRVSQRFSISLEADEALTVLLATPSKLKAAELYNNPDSAVATALARRQVGRRTKLTRSPGRITCGEA